MSDDFSPPAAVTSAPAEASMASLVAGIIGDVQSLVAQQINLTRQEIATNLRLRTVAAAVVAVGAALGFIATTIFCLGLAHALHWWTSPPGADPAWMPVAGCYAIVSAVLFVFSGGLICVGYFKFKSIPSWQYLADHTFQKTIS